MHPSLAIHHENLNPLYRIETHIRQQNRQRRVHHTIQTVTADVRHPRQHVNCHARVLSQWRNTVIASSAHMQDQRTTHLLFTFGHRISINPNWSPRIRKEVAVCTTSLSVSVIPKMTSAMMYPGMFAIN